MMVKISKSNSIPGKLTTQIIVGSILGVVNPQRGTLDVVAVAYHGVGDHYVEGKPGLFTRVDSKMNWMTNFETYINAPRKDSLPIGDLLITKPLYFEFKKRMTKKAKTAAK